jgi:hypothetical protein
MKPTVRAVALAAMASALCASAAFADDSASAPTPKNTTSTLRVVVDPETGEVRAPTAEELNAQLQRENAAAAARSSARASSRSSRVLPAEKVIQRHPNGMLSVKMPHDSLSMLKATKQADGKVAIAHKGETTPAAAEEK